MKSACTAFFLFVGVCLTAVAIGAAEYAAPVNPLVPLVPTVIESAGPGEIVSTATETTFSFRDQVVVTGTNLRLNCDQLVVVAKRTGDPKATIGKQENFKSLIATGRVRLVQNDREATCDRAEVLPGDDKVTLAGNVTYSMQLQRDAFDFIVERNAVAREVAAELGIRVVDLAAAFDTTGKADFREHFWDIMHFRVASYPAVAAVVHAGIADLL